MGRVREPAILGYCTNVHPGESWPEVFENLKTHSAETARLVQRKLPFGVGIWLSREAASRLVDRGEIEKLKAWSSSVGIRIFSINGFPFGNFHESLVKQQVYKPDWSERERLSYTLDLIHIATALAAPGADLGISTLPIGFESLANDSQRLFLSALNLAAAAEALYIGMVEYGVSVHLDLEPEPFCCLENSSDVVAYFSNYLLPVGGKYLAGRLGVTQSRAGEILLDKIRVCYDTCHASIVFETPSDVLSNYDRASIRVGKVQLSSAIRVVCEEGRTRSGASVLGLLEPFSKDRYLHQVVGVDRFGKRARFLDLPDALSAWKENPPSGEYRIHCHVPIDRDSYGELGSTQQHLDELLSLSQSRLITEHWEVETYTWEVLPEQLRKGPLSSRIAQEILWV